MDFFHSYNHHLVTTFSILRSNLASHLALPTFLKKRRDDSAIKIPLTFCWNRWFRDFQYLQLLKPPNYLRFVKKQGIKRSKKYPRYSCQPNNYLLYLLMSGPFKGGINLRIWRPYNARCGCWFGGWFQIGIGRHKNEGLIPGLPKGAKLDRYRVSIHHPFGFS